MIGDDTLGAAEAGRVTGRVVAGLGAILGALRLATDVVLLSVSVRRVEVLLVAELLRDPGGDARVAICSASTEVAVTDLRLEEVVGAMREAEGATGTVSGREAEVRRGAVPVLVLDRVLEPEEAVAVAVAGRLGRGELTLAERAEEGRTRAAGEAGVVDAVGLAPVRAMGLRVAAGDAGEARVGAAVAADFGLGAGDAMGRACLGRGGGDAADAADFECVGRGGGEAADTEADLAVVLGLGLGVLGACSGWSLRGGTQEGTGAGASASASTR